MTTKDSKIQLLRLAHVHYQHPNLAQANAFLLDFGFEMVEKSEHKIFYCGYGRDPYCYVAEQSPTGERLFAGGALVVCSRQELEKAARLPGASPVQKADGPGGGECVVLHDPNGMTLKLLHGQQETDVTVNLPETTYNTSQDKHRLGEFHRFSHGPSRVHKLGHFGFLLPHSQFLSTRSWYLETFNFTITDSVYSPRTGDDETSFMHIDLGETFTDHHVSFMAYVLFLSYPRTVGRPVRRMFFIAGNFD